MEGEDSILEAINGEDNINDFEDVEMLDIEEGECLDLNPPPPKSSQIIIGDVKIVNQKPPNRTRRRKENKKKNRRKKNDAPKVTDINRFVINTCRRLKEKKSYLVWTAVGCLGVSALSELIKEVDAIQACGGQMTANLTRPRTGGGILWNLLKTREPNAYDEIMKKGKEFEKQFQQPKERTGKIQSGDDLRTRLGIFGDTKAEMEPKRACVRDRIRVPVSYDDGLLSDDHGGKGEECLMDPPSGIFC